MTATVDTRWDYAGHFGAPAHCRIRIFQHPDRPTVVIATDLPSNPGTSITNRAEYLAEQVLEGYGLSLDDVIWIEHYLAKKHVPGFDKDRFSRVTFQVDMAGRFRTPKWEHRTREQVETLIGQPLYD